MLKPHVLRPPARRLSGSSGLRRLSGLQLSEGGAARFAAALLLRHSLAEESRLYPEAWLVFREAEEREIAQAAGEVRLTQLTLRLALQLSEYFSSPERQPPPVMEIHSLKQSLRVCLTALESRDRETCREIRLLLKQFSPGAAEKPGLENTGLLVNQIRQRLEKRLEDLAYGEGPVSARTFPKAGDSPAGSLLPEGSPRLRKTSDPIRARTRPLMQALLRQRGTFREMTAYRRPPAGRQTGETLEEHKERFIRLLTHANEEEQQGIWRLAEEHSELTLRHRQQFSEESHLSAGEKLTRLVRESTYREYIRLLQVLEQRLSSERLGLVQPAAEAAGKSVAAEPEEKFSLRASRSPGPVADRQLTGYRPAAGDRQNKETAPSQLTLAAPLLVWLDQALKEGPVQRKAILNQLDRAPAATQEAFLALAEQSGAFHTVKEAAKKDGKKVTKKDSRGPQSGPAERLTHLVRESRRRELAALVRWAYTIEKEELLQATASSSAAGPAIPPAVGTTAAAAFLPAALPEAPPGAAPLMMPPASMAPAKAEEATAALLELRSFLTQAGLERRQDLTRILRAGGPRERSALLAGLLEIAETGSPSADIGREEPETEKLVHLIEHSADPAGLLESLEGLKSLKTGSPVRSPEQTGGLKQAFLLERLAAYVEGRSFSQKAGASESRISRRQPGFDKDISQRAAEGGRSGYSRLTEALEQRRLPAAGRAEADLPKLNITALENRRQQSTDQGKTVRSFSSPLMEVGREHLRLSRNLRRLLNESLGSPGLRALSPQKSVAREGAMASESAGAAGIYAAAGKPAAVLGLLGRRGAENLSMGRLWQMIKQQTLPEPATPRLSSAAGKSLSQPGQIYSIRKTYSIRQTSMAVQTQIAGPLQKATEVPALKEARTLPKAPAAPALQREQTMQTMQALQIAQTVKAAQPVQAEQIPRLAAALPPLQTLRKQTLQIAGTVKPGPARPVPRPGDTLQSRRSLSRRFPLQPLWPPQPGLRPNSRQSADKAEPAYPREEGQLELRRNQPAEALQGTVARAAGQTAELALQRQAPELRLLRRQSQEQERIITEQRQDLGGLKKQLERQEALVRQALERSPAPGTGEPDQVRKLARAVMKEMEGQLRLERQRRGLI